MIQIVFNESRCNCVAIAVISIATTLNIYCILHCMLYSRGPYVKFFPVAVLPNKYYNISFAFAATKRLNSLTKTPPSLTLHLLRHMLPQWHTHTKCAFQSATEHIYVCACERKGKVEKKRNFEQEVIFLSEWNFSTTMLFIWTFRNKCIHICCVCIKAVWLETIRCLFVSHMRCATLIRQLHGKYENQMLFPAFLILMHCVKSKTKKWWT